MDQSRVVVWVAFLTIAFSIRCAEGVDDKAGNKTTLSEEEIVLEKWKKMETMSRDVASQALKFVLPTIMDLTGQVKISSACTGSIMKMISAVKGMKFWVYRMLDASGKLPNGLFSGFMSSLGDYDGCLSVEVPGPKPFRGQYCNVFVTPPLPERERFRKQEVLLPIFANFTKKGSLMEGVAKNVQYLYQLALRTSVCVPSTCSREDIQAIADGVAAYTGVGLNINIPSCDVIQPLVFSKSDIAVICVLSVICLLVFVATSRDVILNIMKSEMESKQQASNTAVRCLMCFSAYTNSLQILKMDKSPSSIKFFHGMKVITVLWVMFNHTYFYHNLDLGGSLKNMRAFGSEIAFQLTANGYPVVETFFFISAVLLAYTTVGRDINIPKYIFRRLWRLTPPFMLVIATSFLLPHMGSGPGWKETIGYLVDNCKANWWTNLLYFNNFVDNKEMCYDWLWYIPVDTHLYILALFVMVFYKRRPKLAFAINAGLFVGATVVSAIFHVYYQLHPTVIYEFSHSDDLTYSTNNNFFRTYTHITTCCIGLCVGCYLATRPKLKIPKILNILGWLTSMTFGLLVVYGPYEWSQGNVPSMAVSTIYACTSKVAWALALSFVTIACFTGNGGAITSILSWSAFVPLSRLTYVAYIIHPLFHWMAIGSTRISIPIDHRTQVYKYLGTILIAFSFAFVVSLLFELPFMGLDRIMFPNRAKSKTEKKKKPDSERNDLFSKQLNGVESAISTISIKKVETDGPSNTLH